MTKTQKKTMLRILIGAVLFVIGIFAPLEGYYKLLLFVPAYLFAGGDVLMEAMQNIANGQVFDENFLMGIASLGAFFVAEYQEAVAVMLFYQVGELFQSYAVNRSRQSIAELMDIRPDYANLKKQAEWVTVDTDEVQVGDVILVRPGEKIPLDGFVCKGSSTMDTAALTGESVPRTIKEGEIAISGAVNLTGVLEIEVTKVFGESTVAKILDLVENASSKKAKTETFITKFARYYTPGVVISAVLLAIFPPLLIPTATFAEWVHRALIFLVISCPCALVISVPLGFFGGIGGASKCGILVKGSNYLEALAETEIVVVDKTGTLTEGVFSVQSIFATQGTEQELLEITALAENFSLHPVAKALREAYVEYYDKELDEKRVGKSEELAGHGIYTIVDGKSVIAGNKKLMSKFGISCEEVFETGTIVHVAVENKYRGYIVISDKIKSDALEFINGLRKKGVNKVVMLTGDRKEMGEAVAKELSLDEVYTELLPADKVEKTQELLGEKSKKGKLVFVGDGINDAPVLAGADIGIAMGGLGSDAAIEAADIVIMNDAPSKILTAMDISQKTLRIVKQNIAFAFAVKGLFLIMGAFGIATMWEAVFADVGVAFIAILNSMRMLNVEQFEKK